jgi:hypothetical protein
LYLENHLISSLKEYFKQKKETLENGYLGSSRLLRSYIRPNRGCVELVVPETRCWMGLGGASQGPVRGWGLGWKQERTKTWIGANYGTSYNLDFILSEKRSCLNMFHIFLLFNL